MRNLSAFYEYLDCNRALLMPGARTLAGWRAGMKKWDELGLGPRPATLDALGHVNPDALRRYVDTLFRFDSASEPLFQHGRRLRPMIDAAAASVIMHFEARKASNEMQQMRFRMRQVWMDVYFKDPKAADTALLLWSKKVQERFVIDNAHLTVSDSVESIVPVVQQLASMVAELQTSITNTSSASSDAMETLGGQLAETRREIGSLKSDLSVNTEISRSAKKAAETSANAVSPSGGRNIRAAARSAQRAVGGCGGASSHASPQSEATTETITETAGTTTEEPARPKGLVLARLMQPPKPATVKGVTSSKLYLDTMRNGGLPTGLQSSDRTRAQLVVDWFNAMATQDEKDLLRKPTAEAGSADDDVAQQNRNDDAERRRIVIELNNVISHRLRQAFNDAGLQMPKPLRLPKGGSTSKMPQMPVGAIESRLAELKKVNKKTRARSLSRRIPAVPTQPQR